jgi:hypothetical protein
MKQLGMALAVGIVLGPLGAMGVGHAAAVIVLAVAATVLARGAASALGYAPARQGLERARRR